MIKLYAAITHEVDDSKKAVRDILEQLNLKENMLKNSVGIIHFYYEFLETEVYEAVVRALPFTVIGCVTGYVATSNGYGGTSLTLTMLTSDDVEFAVHSMKELDKRTQEEVSEDVKSLFREMSAKEMPKLVLTYITNLKQFSGDALVAAANELENPIPLFGTIAFYPGNEEFNGHVVIDHNAVMDTMIFIAIYGDINPKYHVSTSFSFEETYSESAEITDAAGATLKSVNGLSALDYLVQQNILSEVKTETGTEVPSISTIWALPAILSYPNGTRVVRAFIANIEGTEHILSTGEMEIGAKIKFSFLDGEKTLASAKKFIEDLTTLKENDLIAYSCGARAWSLGTNQSGEATVIEDGAEKYKQKHNVALNYSVAYSGGEICPMYDDNGKMINVLHNYTLIACTFN